MGIISTMFIILVGAGVLAVSYMRDRLGAKLTSALKVLGILVGGFLLFGVLAMNIEEGSIGHLLLLLLIGAPPAIIVFCGLFYKGDDEKNSQDPPNTQV